MQAQLISINPLNKNQVEYSFDMYPNSNFWEAYEQLWYSSKTRPPFQSPSYLLALANTFSNQLAVFKMVKRELLMGAVMFRKEGEVYHFLSDVRSDHNYFIFHEACSEGDIREFYKKMFQKLRQLRSQIFLKNMPSWTRESQIFLQEVKCSRMPRYLSKQKVCMVLQVSRPEEVKKFLLEVKEIRERERKLIKQHNAVFEIFTGAEDLDAWLDSYYTMHIRRWNLTETPSKYADAEQRDMFRQAILSWIEDGIAIRFSIRVGDRRIAFATCLIRNNTLIHHTTAFDLDFKKYSPGKVLLLGMAQWMEDNNFTILDFGEGGESYKEALTNRKLPLYNVHLSPPEKFLFVLRAKMMDDLKQLIQYFGLANYTKKMLTYLRIPS